LSVADGRAAERGSFDLQACRFVIRPFRTAGLAAATNLHRKKEVAVKYVAIKHIAVLAALVVSSAAQAASYDYTENYSYIRKPLIASAQRAAQLQEDTVACDNAAGVQNAAPSASYRSCMLQHGWKFGSLTRIRVQATPADPYFSSNVKVAPGHFIDHDNGMDCQNTGGAEVCDPPNGTVRYFDPDQNLPCTRTGVMSICSNM
jgi:hypothetical protein